MPLRPFALAALLLALPSVRAQFEVGVKPAKAGFLLLEPIVLDCQVRNTGAEAVVLGEQASNAVVRVLLRGPDGEPVRRLEGALMEEEIPLKPDQQASFQIGLSGAFEIKLAGIYSVQVQVAFGGYIHTSAKAAVEIARGQELLRVIGRNPPRIFQLLTTHRPDGTHLYVRVDDAEGRICHMVWDVDRYLAGPPVQKLFDRTGRLHLLHQSAPYVFTHSVVAADGESGTASRFKQGFSDIQLTLGPDGEVSVKSGEPLP